MSIHTPWGKSQSKKKFCCGINFYSTASHGGFKVSNKLNEKIPEYMRRKGGWYEEDLDWSIVAINFPTVFSEEVVIDAKETLCNWFPSMFEKFYNVILEPGQSRKRDEETFRNTNCHKLFVDSAFGDWEKTVPNGFVGVYASKGGSRVNQSTWLIPSIDYAEKRCPFGFVFEEGEYEKWNRVTG